MMVTVTKWLIIKHINCVHDLHLKLYLPVSIQETASQLTDELPVYNSIHVTECIVYMFRAMTL